MKIYISELFKYRQYVKFPVAYCFDRKEYKICESEYLNQPNDSVYIRYIPILQIDEQEIQRLFLESQNLSNNKVVDFDKFLESPLIWNKWWEYYRNVVFQKLKEWCEINSINYVYDL